MSDPPQFSYPLVEPPGSSGSSGNQSPVIARPYLGLLQQPFLGFGLVHPLVRDQQGDFAAKGGVELVRSCVSQVLGTDCSNDGGSSQGELPWRPEFGSLLRLLRHRNMDAVLRHLAKVYVVEALGRWEPRVKVTGFRLEEKASKNGGPLDTFVLFLKYDVLTSNAPGNQVLAAGVAQELTYLKAA